MALYRRGRIWWFDFWFQGRKIQESSGYRNKTAAQRAEAKRKADLLDGRAGFSRKAPPPKIEEGVENFKGWSKSHHRPKTRKLHELNCDTLLRYFHGKWMDAITPEMVEEFRTSRLRETRWAKLREKKGKDKDGSTVSPSTVNRALATLRLIYNRQGLKSPTRKGMFAKEEGQTRVVTIDEETHYLRESSQPLRDIATLILHTGMRPEEVFRIEVSNVNLRFKTIFNPWGKTKAAKRSVPLDEEALAILKHRVEIAERARSRYVFWSPKGPGRPENKERPIGSIRKAHDAAIDRAGLEHFRLYDLRHSFATRAAQAGVDVLTLAALLGHTTVQMVSRYVHPSDAHKAEAAKKLENYNAQLVAEMIERAAKKQAGSLQFSLQ
jgi:integrase